MRLALFEQPLLRVREFVERHHRRGACHLLEAADASAWLAEPQVVLRQETARELGGPRVAACFALLWDDGAPGAVERGRVTLVGPDLAEPGEMPTPLAVVITAGGQPVTQDRLHDHLCRLRDAVYGVHLRGVMARILPSQQSVWYRLDASALAQGFGARVLGGALVQAVEAVPGVEAAEVLLVTASGQEVEQLSETAQLAASITEALGSMDQGLQMDCEGCQYQEVCDLVDELRQVHARRG